MHELWSLLKAAVYECDDFCLILRKELKLNKCLTRSFKKTTIVARKLRHLP